MGRTRMPVDISASSNLIQDGTSPLPIRIASTLTPAEYDPFGIVDKMTELYELYVKMCYISQSSLKYPPHSPPIDVALAKSLGIEPHVIAIMEQLPYVEGRGSEVEFFQWGGFADYRTSQKLKQSRDPMYASPNLDAGFEDEDGPYVPPWVLPLNAVGNRGSVIFFDTRNGHITAMSQTGGTSDPGLWGKPFSKKESKNRNSLDALSSRRAIEFFRDITLRLHTLQWIPFQNRIHCASDAGQKPNKEHDDLELLFRTYGWPDAFNRTAFEQGAKRYKEFQKVLYARGEPIRALECATNFVKYSQRSLDELLTRRSENVWDNDPDKSPEEVFQLEAQLETAEENLTRNQKDLEDATENLPKEGESEGESMERAWKDHLQSHINWTQGNLDFHLLNNDENKYSNEIKKEEDQILRLQANLGKVSSLPTTLEEAIRPGGEVIGIDWY